MGDAGRRSASRNRVYSGSGSRHIVCFFTGWLRIGLYFLFDRTTRFQPQFNGVRNYWASLARIKNYRQFWGDRRASDYQCGDDGHGRTVVECGECGAGDGNYVGRFRLRFI